ncbi:MAG: hypothetical protein P8Y09_04430, partial [Deltaproteobacteria bacterium]
STFPRMKSGSCKRVPMPSNRSLSSYNGQENELTFMSIEACIEEYGLAFPVDILYNLGQLPLYFKA